MHIHAVSWAVGWIGLSDGYLRHSFVVLPAYFKTSSHVFPGPTRWRRHLNIVLVAKQLTIPHLYNCIPISLQKDFCILDNGRPDQVSIAIAYLAPPAEHKTNHSLLCFGDTADQLSILPPFRPISTDKIAIGPICRYLHSSR